MGTGTRPDALCARIGKVPVQLHQEGGEGGDAIVNVGAMCRLR